MCTDVLNQTYHVYHIAQKGVVELGNFTYHMLKVRLHAFRVLESSMFKYLLFAEYRSDV